MYEKVILVVSWYKDYFASSGILIFKSRSSKLRVINSGKTFLAAYHLNISPPY